MANTGSDRFAPAMSSTDALRFDRASKAMPAIMHRLEHGTLYDVAMLALQGSTLGEIQASMADQGYWLHLAIGISISQGALPLWIQALRKLVPDNVSISGRGVGAGTPNETDVVLAHSTSYIVGNVSETLAIYQLPRSSARHLCRSLLRWYILLASRSDTLPPTLQMTVAQY